MHCALLLAVVMISLAVLYAVQDAPFLFAVQIIVYTGAILMLFLFVLMLVGVDASDSVVETIRGQRLFAALVGLVFGLTLVLGRRAGLGGRRRRARRGQRGRQRSRASRRCCSPSTSSPSRSPRALLITAALGAMVLAHRERLTPKPTQADLAAQRMRDYADHGKHLGPLPPPGVFARHNAVDTPALLPDGTPSEPSISRVLAARVARSSDAPGSAERGRADRRRRRRPCRPRDDAREGRPMSATPFIVLSAILFTIGAVGVLTRRNAIVVFMCVELMLNASNLALVTFSRVNGNLDGQIAAFFVMVVAAAEVVVGLAIIMTIFRTRRSASVDDASLLKY